jgi:peptidoglycan/LPS O-acetylase OafA/YrhL
MLFHAGFGVFSGGFVGVDVFFVISGYLITTIIVAELRAGRFTLARFYERRARRILPALFFVMLICLVVAWVLMMPAQLIGFGQSLMAVSLFVSNIFFWLTSGYFEAAAEETAPAHLEPWGRGAILRILSVAGCAFVEARESVSSLDYSRPCLDLVGN